MSIDHNIDVQDVCCNLVSVKWSIASKHSGQTSAHVPGLSTSGVFPEHTTKRTVREFVNEILLGIFFWWMNHYLNGLPRMTEDLCGSKRKKGIQFE